MDAATSQVVLFSMKVADMNFTSVRLRRGITTAGVVCLLGIILYSLGTVRRTADPGTVPGIPPADSSTAVPASPENDIVVPRLNQEDFKKIQRGETVEIRVGGGVVTVGNPGSAQAGRRE